MTDVTDVIDKAMTAVSVDRAAEIATRLCAIPSPTGEEERCAEAVAEILDVPGIEVHLEHVVAGRPNVVATVKGTGDRAPLVLNGHLDASIHEGPWRHDPFDPWREGNRLFGGGITDMKGAVAAMVAATEAAAAFGPLPGDLVLHAVMHHDTIGLGAKYVLTSEGPTEGFGICGEPSGLAIHTANGGAAKFEITVSGTTAHVSRQEDGSDALAGAVEVYGALRDLAVPHDPCERLPDLPRLQVGELHAGYAPGAVADRAVVRGDLRTVPGMNRQVVRAALEACVAEACPPGLATRVRLLAVQKPFLGVTGGPLVDAITAAHAATRGAPPRITNELPGQAFVTDAADMAAAGLDTVVYGVGEWHHAPDEWIDVDELADSARVYLAVAATPLT
ncbi:MAG TPA: M20/M25/M40 family metallo-hydrolase [Acidimicrobiales bacterium]|nr:M20/M25/M40 family metallo-hydrolase [Acidimicrobiales bacterium]